MPLVRLIEKLSEPSDKREPISVPGILTRDAKDDKADPEFNQIANLDHLPVPDYQDYFNLLQSLGPSKYFLPRLPVELSRGCWWRKPVGRKRKGGCAFCNLNLQWKGYRSKSDERIRQEIDTLVKAHQVLSVSFVDNLLPVGGTRKLFESIARLGLDFRLFSEIRATADRGELSSMWSAGMDAVQVGIEALSTRLLKKINKGTTAIQNLEIMKYCESAGMPDILGNIILYFPGSDQADIEQTLEVLKFAYPFKPLKAIPFWLGYQSPVWQDARAFGIKRVYNHPYYGHLFPPAILRTLRLMFQGFYGGVQFQKRIWHPVKEKVESWHKSYRNLHQVPGSEPILSYRDGGDFLIIKERKQDTDDMNHRLKGTSRKIYLFCEKNRRVKEIRHRFPDFDEESIRSFLGMMVDKRLMFREGERYLSLAVPIRGWGKKDI